MMMNADGSNNRPLDLNVVRPTFPLATKDNRYIIFADSREQGSSIWRYDTQSGALVHLTANYAVNPTLAPDGQIIYSTNNAARKISLHKISAEGGAETEITSNLSSSAVVSPDGKSIACYYSGEETGNSWRLVVLSAETGKVLRVIAPPNSFNIQNPLERPLAWSRDSRSIYYVNDKTGTSNIFRVEAGEDNPPVQITNFPAGRIFDFSISPDGSRIVMSRGTSSSDIVIFKSLR
jgi:Tol biopolymer transport system component